MSCDVSGNCGVFFVCFFPFLSIPSCHSAPVSLWWEKMALMVITGSSPYVGSVLGNEEPISIGSSVIGFFCGCTKSNQTKLINLDLINSKANHSEATPG